MNTTIAKYYASSQSEAKEVSKKRSEAKNILISSSTML
jgi:hypothetical protein